MALIGILAVFLLFAYLVSQRKPHNFPPGPWSFPILGHLPRLGLEPHKTVAAWKSNYGPIVGIDFASFPCIIISDYKLCKEAYAKLAFAGRPALEYCTDRAGGVRSEGVAFTNGRTWREQRTFTLRRLREFGGFGTKSMEATIWQQVDEFLELLRARASQPITTQALFNVAIVNSLFALVVGKPFAQTDPEIIRAARDVIEGVVSGNLASQLAMFMPWFRDNFPDWLTGKSGIEKQYKPTIEFLRPYVDEHWHTHASGEPRDFLDAYIDEVKATTDPDSSFHVSRSTHSLVTTLLDLFLAGSETSSTTLSWICIFMTRHPAAQERLGKEILARVGASRPPTLVDRKSMPYTEAVIHEVMRLIPVLPLGVFHATSEPVRFGGFEIPEGTMVFINVYEAHHNREYWGDPEEFRPERWLRPGAAGVAEFVRHEAFLPFSTGKRVCPGEQLARDELFLFTVGLFQRFMVLPQPGGPLPELEPKLGGSTLAPKPHKIVFVLRDEKNPHSCIFTPHIHGLLHSDKIINY